MSLLKLNNKTDENTIIKNTVNRWIHLIEEYDLIKAKKHGRFRFVSEFHNANNICRQDFAG